MNDIYNDRPAPTQSAADAILAKLRPATQENPPVIGINILAMQRAVNGGYPVHLYHEHLEPRIVTRPDQEQELSALGYGRTYIPQSYPTMLYRRNMHPRFSPENVRDKATGILPREPWVEERIVRSAEHEQQTRAANERTGYKLGPWVKKITDIEPLPEQETLRDQSLEIARLQGQVEALSGEEAPRRGPGRPRKDAAA